MTKARSQARRTAVLLFAHGTSDGRGGAIAEELAARLAADGAFAHVASAFAMQPPSPAEALAGLAVERVVVVPLLASAGGFATEVLPRLLAEAGVPDERLSVLAPIGLDPDLAGLAEESACEALRAAGVAARAAGVLVAAHGARRNPASQASAELLAQRLRSGGRFAEVAAAFLEQSPFLKDWARHVARPAVVVVPLFTSGGNHEERDLPSALAADGQPLDGRPRAGRRLWLLPALGRHPGLAGLVRRRIGDLLGGAA